MRTTAGATAVPRQADAQPARSGSRAATATSLRSSSVRRVQPLPLAGHRVGVAAQRPADHLRPADRGSAWATTATCSPTSSSGTRCRNTITIGIISTVPQLCMALGIAHLLNYQLRGRTFFRVAMLMPYATSLAAATVIFIELFDNDYGLINWVLHRAAPAAGRLAGLQVASPDRGVVHRDLALDRLQRADLPGRHAGHRHLAVRGGRHRRGVALAAVPLRHHARAAADDPVHHRGVDHRRRRSCSASRCCIDRRHHPTAARPTSTRRWAC